MSAECHMCDVDGPCAVHKSVSRDPAVEAARRVWGPGSDPTVLPTVAAAREALKPIRELHRKRSVRPLGWVDRPHHDVCVECSSIGHHVDWPCDTAKLIYSTEELS